MFDKHRDDLLKKTAPLADRMRPRTLDEFVGQEQIVGPGRLLRRAIQIDQLSSLIFYGPPGTGKTTLARIIANTTRAQFLSINAVLAGVKDIREAIESAQKTLSLYSRRTILFIDEVHRFNKSQQDALLPHVENGIVILIGATTENPYFEVNKALVSRSRIFQLKGLNDEDLKNVARQALRDPGRGYGNRNVRIDDDALEHLVHVANGDARGVLNALELAVETTEGDDDGAVHITRTVAEESIQKRAVLYDKDGDAHYDTISAFIKSIRGSDPDAALYWMAKMVYAGEDPRFIFRRMMILACEDVGMADPRALGIVVNATRAFDFVGLPEGRYHLAHACLYLATAPKSNSSMAFFDALDSVSKEVDDEVPDHLRDASRDGEGFGHGKGYLYPHAYRDHWVAQQYLPDIMQGRLFYDPSQQGYERAIRVDVARRREAQIEAMVDTTRTEAAAASPADAGTARSGWARRTSANTGEQLGDIRDRLLDLANIRKDSLVLDVHARTGLLTFEAARRVAGGSVWACAHDDKSFETLSMMAQRFEPLNRPQVVRAALETLDPALRAAAGQGVAFDAIVGRNALVAQADKTAVVKRMSGLLAAEGKIALADTVPSMGQRLAEIVKLSVKKLQKKFEQAEQEAFSDPDDPLVSWTPASLAASIGANGAMKVRVSDVSYAGVRRLSGADVEFWFREAGPGERPSLGDRLRRHFSQPEVEKVKEDLTVQLCNRDIPWKTVVCFMAASF